MAMPQLSDEQLEQIREFMLLDAAEILFAQMEAGAKDDWEACDEPAGREDCWRRLQAILKLKDALRNAAPLKRLTERAQERRVYQT